MANDHNQSGLKPDQPSRGTDGLNEANKTGEEIKSGATQEDQLEKFKNNTPEGGRDAYPDLQAGSPPLSDDEVAGGAEDNG